MVKDATHSHPAPPTHPPNPPRCRPIHPARDQLRKVKDAPRLLARLQGLQALPDARDFLALQVPAGWGGASACSGRNVWLGGGGWEWMERRLLAQPFAVSTKNKQPGLGMVGGPHNCPQLPHPLPLQASLAATLLLRDLLVHLVPEEAGGSSILAAAGQFSTAAAATSAAGRGLPALPALTPAVLGAAAAAAGGGGGGTPTSADPMRQQQEQGRHGSSPAVPGILFKAAAVINEAIVLCALCCCC